MLIMIMFNLRLFTRKTVQASIYLVPIYLNTKAFVTKDKEDNLAWIRYWIILSLLFALEILLDFDQSYFPCYDYFKVTLLWLCIVSIETTNMSTAAGWRDSSQVKIY